MFERCVVVSLPSRNDRWEEFEAGIPKDWPWPQPLRWRASIGNKLAVPPWWKAGKPAWGCYQSHMRIFECILCEDWGPTLILEDDAVFCEDFVLKASTYFDALPKDWEQAYLGGQHLGERKKQPEPVNPEVQRPFNVNRTHAYMVNQSGALKLYETLLDWVDWEKRWAANHLDHRMGYLHEAGKIKVYTPTRWLVGQAEGRSDISGNRDPERFWDRPPKRKNFTARCFPVVGLHRSGSSLVGRILHELGVHMGNTLVGYEAKNGVASEAQELARLCERAYPYPSTKMRVHPERLEHDMRRFWTRMHREATRREQHYGGKYPQMGAMGDLLRKIVPDAKPIYCSRPLEQSINSMAARTKNLRAANEHQRWLEGQLRKYLDSVEHHTVEYDELLLNPEREVDRIIEWCGLNPKPSERRKAIELINPELRSQS